MSSSSAILVPGQFITNEAGYLRGHGSYFTKSNNAEENKGNDGQQSLHSCIAGKIERVNKLISVKPFSQRYSGEVGDLIIGRIISVESKRWKVDIGSKRDAILQLSSINLPGGVQRMRTYEDQLQMRTLYKENDLICAEIQNINADGLISLHSRSLKYGKLENGQLLKLSSSLIKRLPQHYITFPFGIDVILGKNGYFWVTRSIPEEWKLQEKGLNDVSPLAESLQNIRQRHRDTPISLEDRFKIVRVCNSIKALQFNHMTINPDKINIIYNRSLQLELEPKDMIQESMMDALTSGLLE